MKRFDKKTQMMDAGTVIFRCEVGFGSALGKVRGVLAPYGKVYAANQLNPEGLPSSCRGCDFLLDWSTPWRTRYICCKVSASGDAYAAVFKEGNRSGILRAAFFSALMALFIILAIFSGTGFLVRLACIVLCLVSGYLWLVPSSHAAGKVREIMDSLK